MEKASINISKSKERSERVRELVESNSFKLATNDPDLLENDDMRSVRLQLEFSKPEQAMCKQGIISTVVAFGSARLRSEKQLNAKYDKLHKDFLKNPDNKELRSKLDIVSRRQKYTKYYDEARRFSSIVSKKFQEKKRLDFVVMTGGGPGIMEAANKGADDVGGRSIGLNIDLPKEQNSNPYISPDLCFQFRYFALRKMHFLKRAKALIAFPGGFGTLDEVFEILTLVQTKKAPPLPIVLMGKDYWSQAVNFEFLAAEGFIGLDDLLLFKIVETAEEAVNFIIDFYDGIPPE